MGKRGMRPETQAKIDTITALIREHPDWNMSRIAERMGVTPAVVNNTVRKYKIAYTPGQQPRRCKDLEWMYAIAEEEAEARRRGLSYGQLVAQKMTSLIG